MDKRYQVFISSTFADLKDERQAVLRAILELDHMPAGMELFPAADATAWQIIKDVIDASDYYVLLIGGRYGSLDESGIGYTEKEYEYAINTKKPVIPFLHQNPDNLPRERTETDAGAWAKLQRFRERIENRHTCVYWSTASDLKASVIVALTSAMKRSPAIGWVRADRVPSDATVTEILTLRKRISDMEAQLEAGRTGPPQGAEDLFQGDDVIEVAFNISTHLQTEPAFRSEVTHSSSIEPTWNELFAAVAPTMINEASDAELRGALKQFFRTRAREKLRDAKGLQGRTVKDVFFADEDFDTCLVQFRALGLIRENQKTRSVKDTQTYWTLTPYGDQLMTQLRALRRVSPPAPHQPVDAQPIPESGGARSKSTEKPTGGSSNRRKKPKV